MAKPSTQGDTVYSNCDHVLALTAQQVQATGQYHLHAGWNFCGYVWWDQKRQQFTEEIWRHGHLVATVTSDTLDALIGDVVADYGSE